MTCPTVIRIISVKSIYMRTLNKIIRLLRYIIVLISLTWVKSQFDIAFLEFLRTMKEGKKTEKWKKNVEVRVGC